MTHVVVLTQSVIVTYQAVACMMAGAASDEAARQLGLTTAPRH
jgi:hypothetical protein